MKLNFFKYQGAGNDFVIIDNRTNVFPKDDYDLIRGYCDRRFGIGADGLMLLEEATDADFNMVYYNADGRPGSMCGNGGRCIVAFAKTLDLFDMSTSFGYVKPKQLTLSLRDGNTRGDAPAIADAAWMEAIPPLVMA